MIIVAVMATGGAEAGEGLEQTTEAEGDEDRLDARVVADGVEGERRCSKRPETTVSW